MDVTVYEIWCDLLRALILDVLEVRRYLLIDGVDDDALDLVICGDWRATADYWIREIGPRAEDGLQILHVLYIKQFVSMLVNQHDRTRLNWVVALRLLDGSSIL